MIGSYHKLECHPERLDWFFLCSQAMHRISSLFSFFLMEGWGIGRSTTSKNACLSHTLWTAEHFMSELLYEGPVSRIIVLNCCLEGHHGRKGSDPQAQWSPLLLNCWTFLHLNVIWFHIIMSQSDSQKVSSLQNWDECLNYLLISALYILNRIIFFLMTISLICWCTITSYNIVPCEKIGLLLLRSW